MTILSDVTVPLSYQLKIDYEIGTTNPRSWSNVGTIIAFEQDLQQNIDYLLDPIRDCEDTTCDSWLTWLGIDENEYDEAGDKKKARMEQAALRKAQKKYPVFFFIDNERTSSLCPVDSYWLNEEKPRNPCGVLIVSRETLLKESPSYQRITQKVLLWAKPLVRSEFELFMQWREGNVYSFVLHDDQGNNVVSYHHTEIGSNAIFKIEKRLENNDATVLDEVLDDLPIDLSHYSIEKIGEWEYELTHRETKLRTIRELIPSVLEDISPRTVPGQ